MKQNISLKRIAILLALVAGALLAFAGGLALMNVRADWALALGALLCVAAPVFAGVQIWNVLTGDKIR